MSAKPYLDAATRAAKSAGRMLRDAFGTDLDVQSEEQYDVKLAMDVKIQDLITEQLLAEFPDHAVIGEEGNDGAEDATHEWIIDPIDGTVNFYYNIPHFCVSIALRHEGRILAGVIHDPMVGELWEVADGIPATLNGRPIQVSPRTRLAEAVLTVGFAKSDDAIQSGLPLLGKYVHKIRKARMMGSAALGMAYVACGRLDAFIESGISIWDVAAGMALVESAGGKVLTKPSPHHPDKFAITAWNGKMDLEIEGGTL